MNKIKDRDARTKKRQKAKNKFDRRITLALDGKDLGNHFCTLALNHSEGKVRLLDEGAIVTANGKLDIYIEKGAIKKYAQGKNKLLTPRYLAGDRAEEYFENPDEPMNIDDKYEGTINIGHQDFATFPFIVGTWGKNDLSVSDNGDGRKGLDVDLKLIEAHPLVQALRIQGIPVGVSVEMYLHIDDKGTEEIQSKVSQEDQFWGESLAIDEIFIADFAIVGECGNVGSSGSVDLQGVTMEDSVRDTESMEEATLEETAEENEMPESVEDTVEEAPTDAPTIEDAPTDAPTTEDEHEEGEESEEDESVEEDTADEVEEDEESEVEEDALTVASERIEALETENALLKAQVEALKKSNKKKENKIREYAERDEAFKKKFKGLDVSLGVTKETKKEVATQKLYANGDGIGE